MINSYCDSLEDTFAQLVYYGILAEEDAQCFSVRSSIEGGSFMLAAGAVLLALLNTFVVKALIQYFRDKDELEKRCLDSEPSDVKSDHTSGTASEEEGDGDHAAQIHPVPVLFTDTFRWTLRRDNEGINSSRSFVPEAAGKQDWALVEATVVAIDEDKKYNQPLPVAVLEEDVQSKGPPELDAWKTGYRLKPPVPRPMSDTDEELSSQEILEQSVMEDHFFTVEEELIMDTNQVYGSEHNDAQSEYTEEILEDEGAQPLVPRAMSFSGNRGTEQEVMEDDCSDYFTRTEELIQEANRENESGYNDARSVVTDEYTEEVLDDDEYTEQTFNDIPEGEYDDLTVEDRLV